MPTYETIVESGTQKPDVCAKCGRRPAEVDWTGDGGVVGWIHGTHERRCMICCLEAQIEYAEGRVRALPQLKKELEELLEKEKNK